jgi:tetratricopeptide (TPR) repeat protein
VVWILLLHTTINTTINVHTAASIEPARKTSFAQKGILIMTSSQDIRQRLVWGFVVMLLLTAAAQANTLTKLRVVEFDNAAQLIFSFTHPPSYEVLPELEHKLLVIHLSKTAAKSEYAMPRFMGAAIQDIDIYQDAPSSSAAASESDLRIEVLLKTSAVVVNHQALHKPAGLILHIRQTAPASKSNKGTPRRQATPAVKPSQPTTVSPRALSSSGAVTAPSLEPSPLALRSPASEPAAKEVPQEGYIDMSVAQPFPGPERFPVLSEEDQAAPPVPPTPPALPATEEIRSITGSGTAAETLALLDLYFHRPAAFAAHPSLLWSVAAAYVDLGLYEQGDALYRTIAEHMDNPTLQAAAVLKRGKIALLQGELANAERLLREFVNTSQHAVLLAEAHEALGDTLMAQENFAPAAEAYSMALRHTPEAHKPPQMMSKLGQAQRKAGQWLNAADAFRQAVDQLRLDPAGIPDPRGTIIPPAFAEDLLQQLGDSLHQSQRYAEAVVAYRRVLERSPTAWQIGWTLYHLGSSYEALGQYAEAALAYQELVQQLDAVWSEMGQQALSTLRWRAR